MADHSRLDPAATNHLVQPHTCTDLLPVLADYGFCDALKHSAGEVWIGLGKVLPLVVWCIQFPIARIVFTRSKWENNKLEPGNAWTFLQWLVLEKIVDLAHAHIASCL